MNNRGADATTAFDLERGREATPGAPPLCAHFGSGPRLEAPDRGRRRALRLLPALLLLGGCGQKGALFLPDDNQNAEEARVTPTSVSAT